MAYINITDYLIAMFFHPHLQCLFCLYFRGADGASGGTGVGHQDVANTVQKVLSGCQTEQERAFY